MKKELSFAFFAAAIFLSLSLLSGCTTYNYGTTNEQTYYENPQWAPDYYTGTRYYYFPDIECYYDLATRDFIFLNRGQWYFTPRLTDFYSDFDLFNSYIVIVNVNVYQPWMHHQYYVSHYPRYYYRDYYDYSNIPYVRGFNENVKSAVYWPEQQRYRAREWNDNNLRNNRRFKYSDADRQMQVNTTNRINNQRSEDVNSSRNTGTGGRRSNEKYTQPHITNTQNTRPANTTTRPANTTNTTRTTKPNTNTERTTNQAVDTNSRTTTTTRSNTSDSNTPVRQSGTVTRSSERTANTNYYGKPIGQPVKVERRMRSTTTESKIEEKQDSTTETNKTNTTTRTRSSR